MDYMSSFVVEPTAAEQGSSPSVRKKTGRKRRAKSKEDAPEAKVLEEERDFPSILHKGEYAGSVDLGLRRVSFVAEFSGVSTAPRLLALEDDTQLFDKLIADIMNIAIMSALIAGFVYGSWDRDRDDSTAAKRRLERRRDVAIYLSSHLCTISALTSAFLYKHVNALPVSRARSFVRDSWGLLAVPHLLFLGGLSAFIVSVVLMAWVAYEEAWWRAFFTAVGLMCPAVVGVFCAALARTPQLVQVAPREE